MKTTILIHCPDQSGIICTVTGFVHAQGGNIIYLDQHVDKASGELFMRIESEFLDTKLSVHHFKSKFESVSHVGINTSSSINHIYLYFLFIHAK